MGFVFQNFNLLPRTTALANVMMPLDYAVPRVSDRETHRRAYSLLTRVGLADRMGHESTQMSGGQQQRVAIARSLVNHPPLVLGDEPTGNLDSHTSVEVLQMFRQLHAEGHTVILVTHNPEVAEVAERVIRMSDGLIQDDYRQKSSGAKSASRLIARAGPRGTEFIPFRCSAGGCHGQLVCPCRPGTGGRAASGTTSAHRRDAGATACHRRSTRGRDIASTSTPRRDAGATARRRGRPGQRRRLWR